MAYAYPPVAMRTQEAARFLSMSKSKFLAMVEEGQLPQPRKIGRMNLWLTDELRDAALKLLEVEQGDEEAGNPCDRLLEP